MKRLLCIGMLLLSLSARAQFDVAFTNSWALQSFYNPAVAGADGLLNVQGAYSMQMAGFENAPATMYVGADLPAFFLGPAHGVGIGFMNDKAALFSTKRMYVQYVYHQKLFGGRMSIGVRGGLLNEGFDGSKLDVNDTNDPCFASSQVTGNAFDLDVGLRYIYKGIWYAGVSAMHCLSPSMTMGDDKLYKVSLDPVMCLSGGYVYRFRQPQFKLCGDALLRTDLLDWRGDVTARLEYDGEKGRMYGGLMYSPRHSVAVLLGFTFHGVNIGYSYEMYTTGIGALHGSHELVLGYQTDLNLFKKGKNMHKSVRLL
ncbi:MAG: PorP/SprF family type IX secretion system membrane protein [Bacteroidaceae bacterium]|nr:PorP/SprF family type IX secretion system membrane protein [Bacteroidaceae bacterium]